MGSNCNGAKYVSCQEANFCCQKGSMNEIKKRKMYLEFIDSSQNTPINVKNDNKLLKKKVQESVVDNAMIDN